MLIERLLNARAGVRAYDPVAMDETRRIYGQREGNGAELTLCKSANAALEGADVLAIATEWTEFRSPDFDLIKSKLRQPVIFDGRNIYDPAFLERMGFTYYGVGRGR